jgi:hypothetical protein
VEFIRFHRELRGAKTAVMTSCIYAGTPQPPTPTFISQHIIAKLAGSQDPLPCLHLNINLLRGKMVGKNVQERIYRVDERS